MQLGDFFMHDSVPINMTRIVRNALDGLNPELGIGAMDRPLIRRLPPTKLGIYGCFENKKLTRYIYR